MPVLFLHGVNVRDGEMYRQDLVARDELIRRLLLEPLAKRNSQYAGLEIISPYWGGLGVTHYWNQTTLPDVRLLQDLGPASGTPASDLEQMLLVRPPRPATASASALEGLGGGDPLLEAGKRDLDALLESVLAPLIHSESTLADSAIAMTPGAQNAEGMLQGLLLVAAHEVSRDATVATEVRNASSDDAVLELLKRRVQKRFEELVAQSSAVPSPAEPAPGGLESLGPGWWDAMKDRVGELFDRTKETGGRVASIAALDAYREQLHKNITRFLGDVFVYLLRRGNAAGPGPIPKLVLEALSARKPGEPLVIITHSMGGNIVYDLLTEFDPSLKVDVWISAGGQVGQFEEMKLFAISDIGIRSPQSVAPFAGRVRTWLNIYDPADVLSFLVEPVFRDPDSQVLIKDLKFKSGAATLDAHGAYFKRPSFYELVREELEARL
ncbi:hypothetical protein LJR084_000539 [Variovorax sp. LjRoot84]|uniref:hypothetical protein n=1 Tax=Variovorax sp. LjRoot84 TaxID=3342340 RepID=UPI003ECFBAE8